MKDIREAILNYPAQYMTQYEETPDFLLKIIDAEQRLSDFERQGTGIEGPPCDKS